MSIEPIPIRLRGQQYRHDPCGAVVQRVHGESRKGIHDDEWTYLHLCPKCGAGIWLEHRYPRLFVFDDSDHGFAGLEPLLEIDTSWITKK